MTDDIWATLPAMGTPELDDRLRWQEAIREADTWKPQPRLTDVPASDLSGVIALLRADHPMTSYGRQILADLLERHRLVRRGRGTPPTPAYARTLAEARLEKAAKLVRAYQRDGLAWDDAFNEVIGIIENEHHPNHLEVKDVSPDALENFMLNRRGSTRRLAKRRAHQ